MGVGALFQRVYYYTDTKLTRSHSVLDNLTPYLKVSSWMMITYYRLVSQRRRQYGTDDDGLPSALQGNMFIDNFSANLLSRKVFVLIISVDRKVLLFT